MNIPYLEEDLRTKPESLRAPLWEKYLKNDKETLSMVAKQHANCCADIEKLVKETSLST
jgi:hypothetical protein